MNSAQEQRMLYMCPVAMDVYKARGEQGNPLPKIITEMQEMSEELIGQVGEVKTLPINTATLVDSFNELIIGINDIGAKAIADMSAAEVGKINRMCPVMCDMRTGTVLDTIRDVLNLAAAKSVDTPIADSTASSVGEFKTDFNLFITALEAAGLMDDKEEPIDVFDAGQVQKINDMCPVGRELYMGDMLQTLQLEANLLGAKSAEAIGASTATTVSEMIADYKELIDALEDAGIASVEVKYSVTFTVNDKLYNTIFGVWHGDTVTLPSDPDVEGWHFVKWMLDDAEFTTSTPVVEDIIVVADMLEIFTITFDSQGGSAVEPVNVIDGQTPVMPSDPTLEDHEFKGWFTKPDGDGDEVTSETVITESIVVYAHWDDDE